jgi:hypothetical protein
MTAPPRHYTCVLRWKAGERTALANVRSEHAAHFSPIIEPTPKAFRHANAAPDAFRSILRRTAHEIAFSWYRHPFFIDSHLIDDIAGQSSLEPLVILLQEAQVYGLRGAPVLRLKHSCAVGRQLVSLVPAGATIGLRVDAADMISKIGVARVAKTLETLDLLPDRVHLFVDQGVVETDEPPAWLIHGLPQASRWRGVTLLGGSFPKDLRDLPPDLHHLPRLEWRRFKNLIGDLPTGTRIPAFGDFGTLHAHFEEPKGDCRPSASVRYALEDVWLLLRGYAIANKEAGGIEQFRGHAQFLASHPEFSGAGFSFGDSYIADRCRAGATTGNLTTWLAASMNHHITRTCCSLAALVSDHAVVVADEARAPRGAAIAAWTHSGPPPLREPTA